jgi:hypothetical protein
MIRFEGAVLLAGEADVVAGAADVLAADDHFGLLRACVAPIAIEGLRFVVYLDLSMADRVQCLDQHLGVA